MTFQGRTIAGFGLAFAVLLAVCVFSYRSLEKNINDRAWETHTYLVIETLDTVQRNLSDAETGQRGYIITGDEEYLGPYKEASAQIQSNVQHLRQLTADNPVQQMNLETLGRDVTTLLNTLQDRINIRRNFGLQSASDTIKKGVGFAEMTDLRAQVDTMRAEERRLLKIRSEGAEASARTMQRILVFGDVLGLGFLCLAVLAIRTEMARRRAAENAVQALNAGLEIKVAERTAELAAQAKDLARSNSELQQFAYVASHDLQEPLRMVASFTQLLAKRYGDKLDKDAHEFIEYAVDGANRMQRLISDLLTYSRVGTQGRTLEQTSCDAVLQRVLRDLTMIVQERKARITHDPLPPVLADSQQLGQLFQNLIVNGIKFCKDESPHVHVSAERNGKDWRFSVSDNGIGIAHEHADRIFVIFQRLHTKTEYAGTGIGLAVCKKIVERHGGNIWVESTPGNGATFYFTIPQLERTQSEEERETDELRAAASAR